MIIDALRQRGTATRGELARETGLSRTTVASVVAELQSRDLVLERPAAEAEGRGRPPTTLGLNARAGAAIGVAFGHERLHVAVADLSSTVLAEAKLALDVDASADAALDAAAELVERTLADADVDRARVLGAGLGLPGPIDRRTGTVGSSVILPGWAGVQPAREFERRLGLTVIVDNDANLEAIAEHAFGAARGRDDVLYVQVSSGIGAGLIIGGRLHRGADGLAGELGHVQPRTEGGAVCRCGNRGCLETAAALGPMLELLRPTHGGALDVGGLLALLTGGDLAAIRVVKDAGRAVGTVIAGLCNVFNPAVVVIGGELAAPDGPLVTGVREAVHRYALPAVAQTVEVTATALGDRGDVLGAFALVIGDTQRLRSAGLAALRYPGS